MSNIPQIDIYRKRDFGDLLQDSISFVFKNFVPLMTAYLIFVGPLILLSAVVSVWFIGDFFPSDFNPMEMMQDPDNAMAVLMQMADYMPNPGLIILSYAISLAVYVVRTGTFNSFIMRYGESQGTLKVADLREDIFSHFLPYTGLTILHFLIVMGLYIGGVIVVVLAAATEVGVLIFLAGLALLCLMVYVMVILSLSYFVRMYEGPNNFAAIRRSFQIIKGHWWQTFGVYFVLGVLITVVSMVLGLLGLSFFFSSPSSGGAAILGLLGIVVGSVLGGIFYAMFRVAAALQYFNLTEGHQGASDSIIDEIGQDDPFDQEQ
jgi:hypothetical protein